MSASYKPEPTPDAKSVHESKPEVEPKSATLPRRVAILGGGVAGLSAAHELIERGFSVTVYEAATVFGGKARSVDVIGYDRREELRVAGKVSDEQLEKEPRLPGEHGFRLFPAFYKHLQHTMERIPVSDIGARSTKKAADHLVPGKRVLIAREDPPVDLDVPLRLTGPKDLLFVLNSGISPTEAPIAAAKLFTLLTSSEARWNEEFESTTWWDFIEAERMSKQYQRFLGEFGVRWFAAMDPRKASTRTIGKIGLQLWKDFVFGVTTGDPPRQKLDRFLNGPTNRVWIEPWIRYLEGEGVVFRDAHKVLSIQCKDKRVESVTFKGDSSGDKVVADFDYCIATLPIEPMCEVLRNSKELRNSDPAFRRIDHLRKCDGWMVGIQFYLSKDVPIAPGGLIFADAPWALTAVSQTQFWSDDFKEFPYGEKTVRGVLSVIVSDWDAPGDFCGIPARGCTPQELKDEIWSEIKAHLNSQGRKYPRDEDVIRDSDLVDWYPSIPYDPKRGWQNNDKLLLNMTGSWQNRPEAVTYVPNFFLAGDYIKTHTDLATMEGANEAARRAVNGILEHARSAELPCDLWPLELDLPGPFEALRKTAGAADLLRLRATQAFSRFRKSKPSP